MKRILWFVVCFIVSVDIAHAKDMSFTFKFKGQSYTIDAVIDDVSEKYCNLHTKDWQKRIGTEKPRGDTEQTASDMPKYVDNYPCRFVAQQLADDLHEYWESIPDVQDYARLNLVMAFVNSLPYDLEARYTDYWKTPYETLRDGKGDCEDHAFLLSQLLRQIGFDSALIDMVGHLTVCVNPFSGSGITGAQSDLKGMYIGDNNDFYAWCEATPKPDAECWNVGEKPDFLEKHELIDTRVIPQHHVENVYKMWRNIFEPSYQGDKYYYGNLDYKDDFFNPDPKSFSKGNIFFNTPSSGSK